jgi:hypothetical protein
MSMDLTAGLLPAPEAGQGASIDLSAGLVPARKTLDLSAGLVPSKGSAVDLSAGLAPAHDPNDRLFAGTGQAEVRAYDPSVWDRIKQAVTAGIPNYSSRTIYSPKYGETQLVSPEEALTPSEQRAHPIATGIGEVAGGLTSPQSIALLYGTAGLGELPGAAAMLPRLMAAGFGAQAIYGAAKTYPEIRTAIEHGDVAETERLLTHAVANLAMAAMATQHAATGKGAVSGKVKEPAPTPAVQIRAVEPTSPLGEVLQEPAPSIRVADSAAAAHEILEKDTVLRPVTKEPALTGEVVSKHDLAALSSDYTDEGLRAHFNIPGDTSLRALEERGTIKRSDEGLWQVKGKDALTDLQRGGQARITGPRDTAPFINPTARVVTDSHIPVVSRDEILAHAVSNVISNSSELQNAGIDLSSIKTNRDVDAVLQRASDVVKSNLDPRAEATITFEVQKQLASDLGMSVEDLLARKAGEAFNTEHALAARALLAQSAKHVVTLAKTAAESGDATSLSAATTALAQHQAIAETVAGITAEAGRSLGGFRIDKSALPEVKIANVLSKLSPEAQAEAVRLLSKFDESDPQAVRKLNQFVAKVKPATTLDKLFEYYRNSLLSSPHTIIVKTASEASMVALETLKKALAGGIAKFKSSPDRYIAESWYYAKGMAQALTEHARPILSGEFQLEGSPGFENAGQQAIKGTLGSIIRTPSEAMSRMTNLAYAGSYFGELNSLSARQAIAEGLSGDEFTARQEHLAHHPTDAMTESAHKLAMTNTFQSELGTFAEKIGQAIGTKPNAAWLPESLKSVAPLKWLLPFYKTPVNLVKASLTHATPYELLNGIAKGDTDAIARGVLGSSISAAIAYLAINGSITGGGPTDYKKEETKRATGWQPYSVKIGDRYFSYKRFEPLGLAMGLIADAVHSNQSGDSEVVVQSKTDSAVKHIIRNLDDLPFMGTLSNLLQAVHDPVGGRARNFINREAGSLIPAGVANVAETLDGTIRRPQTALQAIESRIPGLTSAAPPIIDITGHRVQRPASNLGGANPFPWSVSKHDPVVEEMARLGISTPQPPAQIKWKGKPTPLTDAERQTFATSEGQEFYKRVGRLVPSNGWQKRTDDQRRKLLVEVHRVIDDGRAARLSRIRRDALAARDLRQPAATP